MFTGIVQVMGRLAAIEPRDFGARLIIDRSMWDARVFGEGESVAVNGCCLTVVESTRDRLAFDVIPQTLQETNLGDKNIGDSVNLEPSLSAGDPMGGHVVQGHIDGIAKITDIQQDEDGGHKVMLSITHELMKYIVQRGSITLDGVSLTIAEVESNDCFVVALIPTTLEITTLGQWKVGERVNVETDILTRAIVHRLELQAQSSKEVDMDLLNAAGFTDQADV